MILMNTTAAKTIELANGNTYACNAEGRGVFFRAVGTSEFVQMHGPEDVGGFQTYIQFVRVIRNIPGQAGQKMIRCTGWGQA